MKNLKALILLAFLAFAGPTMAQKAAQDQDKTAVKMNKDTMPDKRYANKNLKKDGTPDKRYKSNKADSTKAKKN
ncbi:hypothetical protein [Dyadobacter crusticola]|uniref:hypothetical protein n=1 Tax=Dyadobacter crusticola TaxID=292407 RepID=UPI0004E159DB|nr:hypothetical protein [Dyadobacter crusticola]